MLIANGDHRLLRHLQFHSVFVIPVCGQPIAWASVSVAPFTAAGYGHSIIITTTFECMWYFIATGGHFSTCLIPFLAFFPIGGTGRSHWVETSRKPHPISSIIRYRCCVWLDTDLLYSTQNCKWFSNVSAAHREWWWWGRSWTVGNLREANPTQPIRVLNEVLF